MSINTKIPIRMNIVKYEHMIDIVKTVIQKKINDLTEQIFHFLLYS